MTASEWLEPYARPTSREQVAQLIADLDANATAWRRRGLLGEAQQAELTATRLREVTWEDD